MIYLRGSNQIAYDIKLLYGGHHILLEYGFGALLSFVYGCLGGIYLASASSCPDA